MKRWVVIGAIVVALAVSAIGLLVVFSNEVMISIRDRPSCVDDCPEYSDLQKL